MGFEHLSGSLQSHDHEGGSIGIGRGAVGSHDGGREDVVLHRATCTGIDGMGILPTVAVVELAVVAAGGHGAIGEAEDGLEFLLNGERVVGGFGNAYSPGLLLLVESGDDDFSTNLHHQISHAVFLEQSGHDIATVAFGDGTAIEHGVRILFAEATTQELHFLIPDGW